MAGAGNKDPEGGSSGNGLAVGLVSGIGGARLDFGKHGSRGGLPKDAIPNDVEYVVLKLYGAGGQKAPGAPTCGI